MRDWEHPHLHGQKFGNGAAGKQHAMTVEEEQLYIQPLREVVHWTDDGWRCTDCGKDVSLPPAAAHVQGAIVMLNGDPRATWRTTGRRPNCLKR